MIKDITLPSDSGFYTIPSSNVFITDLEGLGNPDPKAALHEYANAHGGIFLSQYYRSRRITLGGTIVASDISSFAAVRRDVARAFAFFNAEKLVKITTDDNKQLQLNAMAVSDFRIKSPAGHLNSAFWQIELELVDPIIYSQSLYSAQGGIATFVGGTAIPTAIPLALSGALQGALNVTNSGNARLFPIQVKITGPGTNFTISNKTTGKDLSFNTTLIAGDYVVFDFLRRTAKKNGSVNVYASVTGDWWDLYFGANSVTLAVGSGNTSDTSLEVQWRDGYWGV